MTKRQIRACLRCRQLKRRCDQAQPACTRCQQAGSPYSLDNDPVIPLATPSRESTTEVSVHLARTPSTPNHSENDMQLSSSLSACAIQETGGRKRLRKRNRACLSCSRCHRMKVRCDRKLPCARCRASGFAEDCVFTHPPTTTFNSTVQEDPVAVVTSFHSRHRGPSNWKALLFMIRPLCGLDSTPFVLATKDLINKGGCAPYMVLPGNYPFGSPGAAKYTSTAAVVTLLKTFASNSAMYVDTYFRIFDPVYPLLDISASDWESDRFFENLSDAPSTNELACLTQYLMILGLGRSATLGDHNAGLELFLAAESCLMRTSFMFRPSLGTLRSLCLMIFAKRVVNATCWDADSSSSLASLTLRLAVLLGLHQDHLPVGDSVTKLTDWEARRKLWTTILYLNIESALLTGMPSLLRLDEIGFDATAMLSSQNTPTTPLDDQQQFDSSFFTILDIVACVNSDANHSRLTYEDVVEYDLQIRHMMARVTAAASGLRRTALDVFYRRVLLVLHQKFAHTPDAPSHFPLSYWSSLESSLGLLVHQRELCDGDDHALNLVATVFALDFFSAGLSTCIHLLQEEAPLSVPASDVMPVENSIPPRQTILETLQSCRDIWARCKERSTCCRSGYLFLAAAIELIPNR